jgi:protein-tyrosine phosphatase
VIDLHCHILPGLDDGPPDLDGSIALARRAAAEGTRTIAATPHIREDHPVEIAALAGHVDAVNSALRAADVPIDVVKGGELAITKVPDLSDQKLEAICLGGGRYVLVESPYGSTGDLLEHTLFDLQSRGFRPLLAHPERSPCFSSDTARLGAVVENGALCSVTAGSFGGMFGSTVQRFAIELLEAGLVHNMASDAHEARRRHPGLLCCLEKVRLDGMRDYAAWLTVDAPQAILAGRDLPPAPPTPVRSSPLRRGLARLRGR